MANKRPAKCYLCEEQLYYVGDPRCDPAEINFEIYEFGFDEIYVHVKCLKAVAGILKPRSQPLTEKD